MSRVKRDLNREVWEGWTPQNFIDALEPEIRLIMTDQSWRKPFTEEEELVRYVVDNQPYYKKAIPEVNEYFIERYLKGETYE